MECYTTELVDECAAPMLRSVPSAYIITLHPTETFAWLHGVAARTHVVRNVNFKACRKSAPDGTPIGSSNADLLHAYQSLFALTLLDSASCPVLVFEDDARLCATARADLAAVDRFVASTEFSIYSLGSVGITVPHALTRDPKLPSLPSLSLHWRMLTFAWTHAVIYAPSAARAVMDARPGPREHVDAHVLARLPRKFTYARPIAYQRFDRASASENSGTWCVACTGGPLATVDAIFREIAWAFVGAVGLDAERGWHQLYAIQRLHVAVALACLLVCAAYLAAGLFKFRPK